MLWWLIWLRTFWYFDSSNFVEELAARYTALDFCEVDPEPEDLPYDESGAYENESGTYDDEAEGEEEYEDPEQYDYIEEADDGEAYEYEDSEAIYGDPLGI